MGWGSDSSSRVPAWQVQGPEFKPQYYKNGKEGRKEGKKERKERGSILE
jgi:hypothetical protein